MTGSKKIWLILGGSIAILGLGSFIIIPAIKSKGIRERLDKAFNDPIGSNAISGIQQLQVEDAFDTRRFESSGKATISRVEARERAKLIWENYGSWYSWDNESAIIEALSNLGHWDDLSKIAHEFKAQYDEELFTIIQDALNQDKNNTTLLLGKIGNLSRD